MAKAGGPLPPKPTANSPCPPRRHTRARAKNSPSTVSSTTSGSNTLAVKGSAGDAIFWERRAVLRRGEMQAARVVGKKRGESGVRARAVGGRRERAGEEETVFFFCEGKSVDKYPKKKLDNPSRRRGSTTPKSFIYVRPCVPPTRARLLLTPDQRPKRGFLTDQLPIGAAPGAGKEGVDARGAQGWGFAPRTLHPLLEGAKS